MLKDLLAHGSKNGVKDGPVLNIVNVYDKDILCNCICYRYLLQHQNIPQQSGDRAEIETKLINIIEIEVSIRIA